MGRPCAVLFLCLVNPTRTFAWRFKAKGQWLRAKSFFIHHIRHFGHIAAVVLFQNIDQGLDTASGHAFIWVGREAGDAGAAGKMMKEAAAIFNFRISSVPS